MNKEALNGKKILLAEDDPVSREMMQDILSNTQLEVASDGNEAVEKFKNGSFDLVILDIRMPNKDGMQAAREIRGLEKGGKRTVMYALTASVLEEEKKQIMECGFDDFITKPVDIAQIREKIAKGLGA